MMLKSLPLCLLNNDHDDERWSTFNTSSIKEASLHLFLNAFRWGWSTAKVPTPCNVKQQTRNLSFKPKRQQAHTMYEEPQSESSNQWTNEWMNEFHTHNQGWTIWGNYLIAIISTNIAIAIQYMIFLFNVHYVLFYSLNKQ